MATPVGGGAGGEALQERLKEQVNVSVRESLGKTTTILSNLHRVQSYLDILCTLTSSSPAGIQGLKNAMLQMRTVRNDTASLLQTVYLAEIGIQSLQDCLTGGGAGGGLGNGGGPTLPPMPSLIEAGNMEGVDGVEVDRGVAGGGASSEEPLGNYTGFEDTHPPAKKRKGSGQPADVNITITACTMCGKKFANQPSPSGSTSSLNFLCRVCRQGHTPSSESTPLQGQAVTALNLSTGGKEKAKIESPGSRTPRGGSGGGGRGNRMSCRLCGASFLYKRCLHRHIRENHTDLDLTNIAQYIVMGGSAEAESPAETPGSNFGTVATPFEGRGSNEESTHQQMLISISEEMGVAPAVTPEGVGSVMGADEGGVGAPQTTPTSTGTTPDGGGGVVGAGFGDKYTCPTCNKVFDRPYRLQRHLQIHNPNRPKVKCQLCDKVFTRMDTLENHMKCLHSNDRPYKCTFEGCPKRFPLQSALIHHLKIHMDGKPYKCNECDASFALLGEFRTHISEQHADTKDLRCTECYRVFPSPTELSQHVRLEHRLECEVCNKTFSRLAYLQAHIEVHNGQSLFNCRYCTAGFDSEYAYKKHLKTHPREPRPSRRHSDTMDDGENMPSANDVDNAVCNVCDLVFQDTEALMLHYRSDEHRVKVQALGLEGTAILHTIDPGGISSDICSLVDEVAGSIGAAEVDERLMQSIGGGTIVTIDPVGDGGRQDFNVGEGEGGVVKRVRFQDDVDVYGRKAED